MSEFEEWFENSYPEEDVSRYEMKRMNTKNLREIKKYAARKAWNAALNQINTIGHNTFGCDEYAEQKIYEKITDLRTDDNS